MSIAARAGVMIVSTLLSTAAAAQGHDAGANEPARAKDEKALRALFDQAIAAAGGRKALSKARSGTWTFASIYERGGQRVDMTGKLVLDGKGDAVEEELLGAEKMVTVIAPGGVEIRQKGTPQTLTGEAARPLREAVMLAYPEILFAPEKPGVTLTDAGHVTLPTPDGAHEVERVTISVEGRELATLAFDAKTHLPVAYQQPVTDPRDRNRNYYVLWAREGRIQIPKTQRREMRDETILMTFTRVELGPIPASTFQLAK